MRTTLLLLALVTAASAGRPSAAQLKARCQAGSRDACVDLANRHLVGDGVERSHSEALSLVEPGVAADHARSLTLAGFLAFRGQGVPLDVGRATGLLRRAVAAEDPEAGRALAYLYLDVAKGLGPEGGARRRQLTLNARAAFTLPCVAGSLQACREGAELCRSEPRDSNMMIAFYERAGELGDVRSMVDAASSLEILLGDHEAALGWRRKAAAKGHEESQEKMRELEPKAKKWRTYQAPPEVAVGGYDAIEEELEQMRRLRQEREGMLRRVARSVLARAQPEE